MKTIYKEPRASKPQANEVLAVKPLNTTKTLRRVEGTRYDLIVSYNTPIAYVVDVDNGRTDFINQTKVILCNHYYSATTRKHQAWVREHYGIGKSFSCELGEFDLGAFKTRSKIDGVDVLGGVNGGTNTNWLHA